MRIGIDARMYSATNSGLGRYVEQLILHLGAEQDEHEYVVFLRQEMFATFVVPNSQWKKVCADIAWYGIREQLFLPRIIAREHIDLMHFPHWNVPWLYRKPFVLTIHDLIMFHFSRKDATTHGPLMYAFKDWVHRVLVRSCARRARHIFATSEFTKQDIVDTLHIDPKKITVTYQAPFSSEHIARADQDDVLTYHGISRPYVLTVGNAYPHKNLERLTDAWGRFVQDYPEYQLVLVGKPSPFFDRVEEHVHAKHYPRIVFTGFVSDEELAVLYDQAHLYAFPSQYEGFGLPPLEAMTHGVPVISSSASCLPEVLGSAAMYFDPESVDDMVRALTEGARNEELRYALRQNAKDELKRYSWNRLAAQTRAIYLRA